MSENSPSWPGPAQQPGNTIRSIYGGQRFTVYYCHSYSAWEKGGNENFNRMVRRWFPKGTDFSRVTRKELAEFYNWIYHYPPAPWSRAVLWLSGSAAELAWMNRPSRSRISTPWVCLSWTPREFFLRSYSVRYPLWRPGGRPR